MSLVSGSAWESDPELKALRAEFVASLTARRAALRLAMDSGLGAPLGSGALRDVAHKLAGVAGSYGFAALGRIAGLLEDLLAMRPGGEEELPERHIRLTLVQALARALEIAIATQADPVELLEDKALEQAIFVAESLLLSASL